MHARPPTAVCWKSTNKSLDSAVTGRYCAVIEIKSHTYMMTSLITIFSPYSRIEAFGKMQKL